MESGTGSNVAAHTVCIMAKSDKNITGIDNAEPISGGTAREEDGDYYDRIFAEYDNSKTYLGMIATLSDGRKKLGQAIVL